MWRTVVFSQSGLRNAIRRCSARGVDRHGLVVRSVDDESRYVERWQVTAEVGARERFRARQRRFQAGLH